MKIKDAILVVDDEDYVLRAIHFFLGERYDVVAADSCEAAIDAMLGSRIFKAALIDVRLGAVLGDKLGAILRDAAPEMPIIIMSGATPDLITGLSVYFDYYLLKGSDEKNLEMIIEHVSHQRRMGKQSRLRRLKIMKNLLLECGSAIKDICQQVSRDKYGETVKFFGTLQEGYKVSWVDYSLKSDQEDIFNVGVASHFGCGLGCRFCVHRDKTGRPLSSQEIVCQAIHSFNTYMAKGLFDDVPGKKPVINVTGSGEPMANVKNVTEAFLKLESLEELRPGFVITSIGLPEGLEYFVEKFASWQIGHYWSVNSCFPETRAGLMPATRKFDFQRSYGLYKRIAEESGRPVTASFILFPGINDREADLERMLKLFGDRKYFRIKLQPYSCDEDRRNGDLKTANAEQLKNFRARLESGGADARVRFITGSLSFSGCGSTDPKLYANWERLK